jgi:hypothetical protein
VARILGQQDCLLVGGLAVGSYGYIRATKDVDFIVRGDLAAVRKRLLAQGIAAVLTQGDPFEGDFPCLKAMVGDVRVDVMPPLVALAWDRAVDVPLSKTASIRVVDLVGLLQLKLKAGGPKDIVDVAALVLRHPAVKAQATELASAFGLVDTLERWLADSRLKADVLGTKAERTLQRLADGMRTRGRGRAER